MPSLLVMAALAGDAPEPADAAPAPVSVDTSLRETEIVVRRLKRSRIADLTVATVNMIDTIWQTVVEPQEPSILRRSARGDPSPCRDEEGRIVQPSSALRTSVTSDPRPELSWHGGGAGSLSNGQDTVALEPSPGGFRPTADLGDGIWELRVGEPAEACVDFIVDRRAPALTCPAQKTDEQTRICTLLLAVTDRRYFDAYDAVRAAPPTSEVHAIWAGLTARSPHK